MSNQNAVQDDNRFPGLIAHSGTAGTAETIRVVADSAGNLGVNVVSGEIIASLGTIGTVQNIDAGSVVVTLGTTVSKPMALALDGTQTSNVTYVGMATLGAAATANVWQVKKIDESGGTLGDLVITYADGNANFDNPWTGRATASYS